MSTNKQQILETITSVSRLITLSFKPKGTKIAIRDHNIVLCEPISDISSFSFDPRYYVKLPQSIDRYLNGDSREDIYILNHVITNFIEWYIIPYKRKDLEIYRGLINLARFLRVGLRELQATYGSGNAVGTLQYYINVLGAVIDESFYPEMLYNPSTTGIKSFLGDDNDVSTMYSTIFDIQKFKTFWSRKELKSICNEFENCFKNPEDDENIIFKPSSISPIYQKKEQIHKIPKNTAKSVDSDDFDATIDTTCDTTCDNLQEDVTGNVDDTTIVHDDKGDDRDDNNGKDKGNDRGDNRSEDKAMYRDEINIAKQYHVWPVPKSLGNVIVTGHLACIYNILDIMDKRFTDMLNKSVKGTK